MPLANLHVNTERWSAMMSETEVEVIWRFLASFSGAALALALAWVWRRWRR